MNNVKPKIAVLLAAYNGEKYIKEQIISIQRQIGVDVTIFISLDQSNDSTLEIINSFPKGDKIINLPYGKKFGSAGNNFFRLIKDVDFSEFDFISFSDQDDIWLENKLIKGCEKLTLENKDCYSSNVTAFWENGKTKEIKKSFPQKKYDHFFEAAGPGCTYIIKKETAKEIKSFIINNYDNLSKIKLHDWLIYSWARCNRKKWIIDDFSSMNYRQHSNNQVGANSGFKSALTRFKLIINGNWIEQIKNIYNITKTEDVEKLEEINKKEKEFLRKIIFSKNEFRRNSLDSFFLKIAFLYLFLFKK